MLTTDRSRRLPREEVVEGISVLRVPAWPRRRDYYFAPGIAAVIRQRRWDLVHCQGIHNLVPLIAMISARRAGIPYLVTFHTGGHSSRLRNAMRTTQWRLVGPLLRNAVSLIAVSRFEAAALAQHARLGDKAGHVIRNGEHYDRRPGRDRPLSPDRFQRPTRTIQKTTSPGHRGTAVR